MMALELKQKIKEVTEAMKSTKNVACFNDISQLNSILEGYPTKKIAKSIPNIHPL